MQNRYVMYETNHELELAYRFIQYTGKNVFLTGKAGTGKTTFLRNLREHSPKRMVVVAPTGVAAINAGGVTIHSLFQMSFGPYLPDYERTLGAGAPPIKFHREKINILRSIDLLVIDEISMVRADLLDGVDNVLRRFRNRSKPFGGVQLLMIGDLQQLAPVAKEDEWDLLRKYYDTPYFFSSHSLKKTDYVSIELKKVYRQSDEKFISLLNKIRNNCLDAEGLSELNKRYIPGFAQQDHEGYITLTTHNYQAQQINATHLERLPDKPYTFKAKIDGEFPGNSYPTEAELVLKEGTQVMFIKNDPSYEKKYYNGKIGKVVTIDEEGIMVQCADSDIPIEVTPQMWENSRYEIDDNTKEIKEKILGVFTQYPLKTAWAITIHKSQGLTFEKAVINANASFAHGQVYVALSRCKSLEGLVLEAPLSPVGIISDGTVRQFTDNIEQNTPTEAAFKQSKLEYELTLVNELFDFISIQRYLYQLLRVLQDNPGAMSEQVMLGLNSALTTLKNELIPVAEKFNIQLRQLVARHNAVEDSEAIQDRLRKGSTYFMERLNANVCKTLDDLPTETDNKLVRKSWGDIWIKLKTELGIKQVCLQQMQTGFSVKNHLDTRAKASIDEPKEERRKKDKAPTSGAIPHPKLYAKLREWRDDKAVELDGIAYRVLQQKTLLELLDKLPATYAELKEVKGLGKKKLQQFGAEILELIRCYREQIELDNPTLEALASEGKPSKTDTKQVSFELFKQGKSIEDIAEERGMVPGTIEGHLAHYVMLGELDIEEVVATDKLRILTDYFSENKPASLSEAKQAVSDDISWGELRLFTQWLQKSTS